MEVRFDSKYDGGAVFGIIYKYLVENDEYEDPIELPSLRLPKEFVDGNEMLKFQPHYRLINKTKKNLMVQIGPKVFSIIITNEYPGWNEFLVIIKNAIDKLHKSQVISLVNRMALRYINFFETNILEKSNLKFSLDDTDLSNYPSSLQIDIPKNSFENVLRINNNATVNRDNTLLTGSIIDIDTFIQKPMENFFQEYEDLFVRFSSLASTSTASPVDVSSFFFPANRRRGNIKL